MAAKVTLQVGLARTPAKEVVFSEPAVLTLGRADDCTLKLPDNAFHQDISRHHCLFDIDPPEIGVRDLGSRNGTFVNEEMIGQRYWDETPTEAAERERPERILHDGDEVRIGHVVVQVHVWDGYPEEAPQFASSDQEMFVCAGI